MLVRSSRRALVLLAAGLVGCSGGEAPRHSVQGTVTLNGKPYPGVAVQFVPEPTNLALAEAEDVTGPEGNYKLINNGRAGLPTGKYKVIVVARPSAEEAAADQAKFEDEEQRRMAMMSLGIDPAKKAAKAGKPGGEFPAEVTPGENQLDFDVKGKTK
ncbi:carboxypeptidase-like regulatory domain-containing protein [Paludisphaera rhizosphaerae]|uniref:carboxypeptidase-like regulatory domain-containing protein n=1 Tax=Paludisphaera rhizosphaerae TaxID=2711216 RepID=UPI0013EBAA34|nr:carboxypeptidase-like regulatory domain-containing protein [Paludisphaera rhizosphaerae]